MIGYCVCGSFPAKGVATSTTTLSRRVLFSHQSRGVRAIRDNFATFRRFHPSRFAFVRPD